MNAKWVVLNALFKKTFAKDMVCPGESDRFASIVVNDYTVAILEDLSPIFQNTIKLQLRASVIPGDAAKISITISSIYSVALGPHFVSDDKGKILYGEAALEYVWGSKYRSIQGALFDEKALEQQYSTPN
jgi:hypothetical protein